MPESPFTRASFFAFSTPSRVLLLVHPPKTGTRPAAASQVTSTTRSHSCSLSVAASPVVPQGIRNPIPLSICQSTSARSAASSTLSSLRKGVTSAVPQPFNSIMLQVYRFAQRETRTFACLCQIDLDQCSFHKAEAPAKMPGLLLYASPESAAIQLGRNVELRHMQGCAVDCTRRHIHALHEGRLELRHLLLGSNRDANEVRHRGPGAADRDVLLQHG